ncbi:MAG TPA: sialidase family protein [Rhodanobacter sp.]|nr:sialidase family protein [Rhodanobacter sp.]
MAHPGSFLRQLTMVLLGLLPLAALANDMPKTPTAPALGASAAFDTLGRLYVVDAANGHVRLRRSDDDGATFSAPVNVNMTAEPIYADGENRPKIALGPHDELYVSWSQPRAKPWTGFVRFARSLDGGDHFSAPLTVHRDRHEITHRFDSMAVDGHGRVVIAWIDKRDLEAASAAGKPYQGAATYYSWADDGIHFAPERKLMDHSCECCRIALARTPHGDIAGFFRGIWGDNLRDHAYATLRTDGQISTVKRATFSDWQIAGCPHQGPGLAVGADGVRHAVWYEAAHGATIWYGQLNPGRPPRHPLAIAHAGASHADVAADGSRVWLAWNQVDASGYALVVRTSNDGGKHFSEPRTLARSAGDVGSPQLLLKHGRAFVAWNTAVDFRLLKLDGASR